MKYMFIAIALFALCGCSNSKTEINNDRLYLKGDISSYPVREFEYDGCEYLAIGDGNSLTVIHKNNCKYCLGRNK